MTVSLNCLPERLSQCAEMQRHKCTENCLIRKWSLLECKKKGWDPRETKIRDLKEGQIRELLKCKKNFPKTVPAGFGELKAHVIMDYTKIVRYHPARDDPMINGCHPMISHMWNANTDMQVLHGQGMLFWIIGICNRTGSSFAVAAYVTSYISKVDKFNKVGWKDLLRELDKQIKNIAGENTGM